MNRYIRARALPALLAFALVGMPLGAQQPPPAATQPAPTQDRDRGFDWGLLGLLGLLGLMGMRGRGTVDHRHDTATTTRRV